MAKVLNLDIISRFFSNLNNPRLKLITEQLNRLTTTNFVAIVLICAPKDVVEDCTQALAYKGIDYEQRPINLLKDGGENYSEDYLRVNPFAQVPALHINDVTIIQSPSILEYLEEIQPSPALLPKDAVGRATVRSICECIGSGIQPLQNNSTLNKLDESLRAEWAQHWIKRGFAALEKILQKTAGEYCFGNALTLADCYLVPQVNNANRFKVDVAQYPTISRVVAALQKLEAFQVSHPSKQPDCPKEFR